MKLTTKTTLILIGVLIIGIVIGSVGVSSYLRFHHERKVAEFRRGRGFVSEMERIIDPRPEQKDQIHLILKKHSRWIQKFSDEQIRIFVVSLDSLNLELSKVLTPDQMKRFEHRMEQIRHRPPRPIDRRPGPPPPPPFGE
ncbi:MAG: hypothetical protein COT43_09110 [Candidatus Marinimicrobia bacterium CG08_land_8_20_14_0_20_45_22]|nr:MAG: hypothetical protein COT43_09110 [Candidatus Marinimicrobia bacterium CG08_land_8_20_14_0_20_45_22]